MRIQELLKEDAREYYDAVHGLVDFCECDGDKACATCIDGELYGTITTTQQGNPSIFDTGAVCTCNGQSACTDCVQDGLYDSPKGEV